MLTAVITTINRPSKAVVILSDKVKLFGGKVIIVGDEKTPEGYNMEGYVSLSTQNQTGFALSKLLPTNTYARKNIGYLMAFNDGATSIYDTDDDTYPSDDWRPRGYGSLAQPVGINLWENVYNWFSEDFTWPRGLPLQYARNPVSTFGSPSFYLSPIQQCLVDKSPDVDSVCRMLYYNQEFVFNKRESLRSNSWTPINSQNTWWFQNAFPLMYLPSTCSFRATDIWRGMIAQKCLWKMGYDIVFHQADAIQERNPHNLLHDFELEIPVFLNAEKIVDILNVVPMGGDVYDNLLGCYLAMGKAGLFKPEELDMVNAWIIDCKNIL